jgi:septal ring factor EnvC (AmiA/AmiB activator)
MIEIDNALVKLRAILPFAEEFEDIDATRAKKMAELAAVNAELAAAKLELNNVAVTRDKAHADIAQSKAELVAIQAALAATYRDHERLEREIKKMK